MSAWRDIETAPGDGTLVRFRTADGMVFIAPSSPHEPTRQERREIYQHSGDWPNVRWNPTHWQPLSEPPA